jgi:hypothetical protein
MRDESMYLGPPLDSGECDACDAEAGVTWRDDCAAIGGLLKTATLVMLAVIIITLAVAAVVGPPVTP